MSRLERYREYQLLLVGLCLMVALILSSLVITNGIIAFKRIGTETVSVTGAASQFIASDLAVWQPMVSRRGNTMAEAYTGLTQDVQGVRQYFMEQGLKTSEITMLPAGMETEYKRLPNGNYSNEVEGYIFRQTLRIETTDVSKIQHLSNQAMELVNRGITFQTVSPEYYYTKLDDMKVKMLGLATENARERAQAMAKSTGNRVGHMRSSHMGVFQITAKHSTDVSDYGINDTSTPDKKVTAVVNVTFSLR